MLRGSCLCGAVAFEVSAARGPFELCHCTRCRKVTSSGPLGSFHARAEDYRLLRGRDAVVHFELPVRDEPPPYQYDFCGRCGCVLPGPLDPREGSVEIPAGLIDDELTLPVDRHIFVEHRTQWGRGLEQLEELTGEELRALRAGQRSKPT